MKIYTRGGDRGETSLLGGGRVRKDNERIAAYGTIDELNSFIGLACTTISDARLLDELAAIQSDLFDIGAQLASPGHADRFRGVDPARIDVLEHSIDAMERELPPLTNFVLPGGSAGAAHLHVARTICRRAERLIVALGDASAETETTIAYVNRLSDWLFVAARYANHIAGVEDVPWISR